MTVPADDLTPSGERLEDVPELEELAGLDVLPDSYRVRDDLAIPHGYIVVRRSGWQDTSTPPTPPKDAMDARRLERTARFAAAHPRRHAWAALTWRLVRRFRGDSRSIPLPAWWPRGTTRRPRACRARSGRGRGRRRKRHRADAGDPDGAGSPDGAAGERCSWG